MERMFDSLERHQETAEPVKDEELKRCSECGHELGLPPPEVTASTRALGALGVGAEMSDFVKEHPRVKNPVRVKERAKKASEEKLRVPKTPDEFRRYQQERWERRIDKLFGDSDKPED